MPFKWQFFRIICVLQILLSAYFFFTALSYFLIGSGFSLLLEAVGYAFVCSLAVFALSLLNTNYPDKPVIGKQKSNFNWLFLINFLLLAFLFAIFFSSFRSLRLLISRAGDETPVPKKFTYLFISVCAMLLFQFIILYGLYALRKILYRNYVSAKHFEFEK